MAEFTFFEIHLDDASIEGSADGIVSLPFSSVTRDDADGGEPDEDETEGSAVPVKPILLLVLAVAIAALVRRRRNG